MRTCTIVSRAVIVGLVFLCSNVEAQLLSSCGQWANVTTNGYNVYNNIWGSGAGSQCITVNAYNNWYVDANHTGGGIKSYPNVEKQLSYNVDNMPAISSTFAVTRPTGGAYSSTYDIWYNNYAYEIMLWMNYTGALGPISYNYGCSGYPSTACPVVTNVTVGGHTWNVYRGNNGGNEVFSFLRTSNTNSGTVDIKAISQWLRTNGWFGNVNMHSVQFGFEITSTSGNQRYSVTNFNVTTGTSCTPTTITPYLQVNGGSWQQTSSASLAAGGSIKFGPQPASGGSWSWTGPNGFTASTREVTISNIQSAQAGSYVARYTNSSGCQSTHTFTVTVTGGGGSSTITVRARGTSGAEQIQLRTNGNTIATWTLTTAYQNYSATGSGAVSVHFINDSGGRDVQVDYVQVGSTTYQAENQSTNTGVWQNNACGGSNSEWLHCNGYINFNSASRISETGSSPEVSISVYPNPVSDFLTIQLDPSSFGSELVLVNTLGQRFSMGVLSETLNIVDLTHLPAGLYIVNIRGNEVNRKFKVYKQ